MFHRCLIACLLSAALGAAEKLHLGISAWAAWTPALAGEAKGLWNEEGLEVMVTVYEDDAAILADMEAGKIDLAMAMLGNFVGEQVKGRDLVILGETDWSHGGDKVIIRRGVAPADLRGATIGIYLDQPSVRYFLQRALAQYKLDEKSVVIEEVNDTAELSQRFIDGRYPLIVNFDPEALRAVRQGNGSVVASSATFPGIIPEGFGMLRSRRAMLSEATLVALFRGWFRSVDWAADPRNWPAYVEILRARVFGARCSEADLLTMVAAVRIHSRVAAANRNAEGGAVERYLQELSVFLRDMGEVDANWTHAHMFDTAAFRKACQ